MYSLLLVVCACLSLVVEARTASSPSGLQPRRASVADSDIASVAARMSRDMRTYPGTKNWMSKLFNEQPYTVLEDPDRQGVEQAQREEPADPLNAGQPEGKTEDDAECEMHVDKLSSVMMKKNIGAHKIKTSEEKQLLASGWHEVDPEQPGAVKVVCGGKERHLGLRGHCLMWKDGKPTLKKEEEVAALMLSDYINKDKSAPGVQKVSCDYLRVFYIGSRPKPPPEEKKKTDGGQLPPVNIAGIDWKNKLPPGAKVVGMKLTTGQEPSKEEKKKDYNKGSDVVEDKKPRGHRVKCE